MGVLGFLSVFLLTLSIATLWPGAFFIGKHEGDALHLLEIIFRMEAAERPHLDFMTPIGVMAFAPIVAFLEAGLPAGQAIFAAQITVGCVLLPAVWWVGVSRLSGPWPYIFGAIVLTLAVALVHGQSQRSASISMHYNRWAWAVAFVAIAVSVLPAKFRQSVLWDGGVVGLALCALALTKMTYFVAFGPVVLLGAGMLGSWRVVAVVCVFGICVATGVTGVYGVAFWGAYAGDLLSVARSDLRSYPGEPFVAVIAAPAFIGASLIAVASVIVLRQGQRAVEGLLLLLLLPGFFYVTFQNFGNDPQWLMLLGVLLAAQRPAQGVYNARGWSMAQATLLLAVAALAMSSASFFNMLYSPFRHAATDVSVFTRMLPRDARHTDLMVMTTRAWNIDVTQPMTGIGAALWPVPAKADRPAPGFFNGEVLTGCDLKGGMVGWLQLVADDLRAAGYAGAPVYVADLFSGIWLFGPFARLPGGAPWYYGGLSGFAGARYVVVPVCAVSQAVRKKITAQIDATGVAMTQVRRTPFYTLFEKPQAP
ncbi:MAG: hypothetical protein ACJA1F_001691 [Paracoccaceae bacterium]|jgi:hypothetical protein